LVSVHDTGIGIRQEDIPTIFEQFRQVDGSLTRKAGGTGLGIPISRSLVELHGGEMWVESELGTGSTFLFTIPVSKPLQSKTATE
jgi:signal transduction histidine kinase